MEHNFEKYCTNCGTAIDKNAEFCPKCGTKQTNDFTNTNNANKSQDKVGDVSSKWLITLLLCLFVGSFGSA